MNCLKCEDNRVVWTTDPKWGTAVCDPCPNCNAGGLQVEKDYSEILKKLEALGK